jgi:hypothetical protein
MSRCLTRVNPEFSNLLFNNPSCCAEIALKDFLLNSMIALPITLLQKLVDLSRHVFNRVTHAHLNENVNQRLDADACHFDGAVV